MKQAQIIKGFAQLGKLMTHLGEGKDWTGFETGVTESEYHQLNVVINKQFIYNGWFTKENVRKSLFSLGVLMTEENLSSWMNSYTFASEPKRVAVIMAGNIPLVGFHDFLSVLLSGHIVLAKLSSDDKTLLPALANHLIQFVPELKGRIEFSEGKLNNIEAVIATGSDNSLKYFEQYFGKYPHIFRKNRTSVAVLNGRESNEDLKLLANDIFDYFGLGCRNVSHMIIPQDFDLNRFFEAIVDSGEVVNNKKYGNNYDYNKAVFLMNKHELLDNNFVLLKETKELHSPLAMLYYHRYSSQEEIKEFLNENQSEIQAIVGDGYIPLGQAQCPMLSDYADGVDTVAFLNSL